MRLRGLAAVALAALLAATCGGDAVDPGPQPAPTGTIAGRVAVEGAGLPGILVSLTGAASQSTATGADGSFQFVSVPAGSHSVNLTGGIPDDVLFSRTTLQVTISSAGQQARADFSGEYLRTSSIGGAVLAVSTDAQPRPVEGIVVRMTGRQEATDTTDAAGRYEFAALRAGEYTVSLLNAEGYAFDATTFTATLLPGQALQRDFVGAGELFIVTDSLGPARVAFPFSARLVARGGGGEDLAWSLDEGSQLPRGLSLRADGAILGTPVETGVSEFGVSVTNAEMERAEATLSLRVCEGDIGLGVGAHQVHDGDDLMPCGFFVQAPEADAYYRVTLVDTDAEAKRVHDVEVRVVGTPATPSPPAAASAEGPGGRARHAAAGRVGGHAAGAPNRAWREEVEELLEKERAYARAHARIRRSEAELVGRMWANGPLPPLPDRSRQAARDGAGGSGAPEEYEFKIGDPFGGTCEVDTTVTAKLVAENDHLAFYEYQTSVSPDNVRRILDYYDQYGDEVIRRYFGGVSDVNADGVVNVLVRPDLPGGTRAFVWSADMTFSRETCTASNEMELIHIDAGTINNIGNNDYWVLGTIVHEMKHVSSLHKRYRWGANRSPYGNPFHPLWVEEGRAEIAKEISSRLAWHRMGGPALADRVTGRALHGAISSTSGTARAEAYGVFTAMARVVWAFSPDSSAVTFEHSRDDDAREGDVYGSGWHFHRFLLDGGAVPGGDEAFMRRLNDSTTWSGVLGISNITGTPIDSLLIQHAIAMTLAGSESVAGDGAPRFAAYDFPSATEIFSQPNPPGFYPWPVTTTGEDTEDVRAPVAAPLATAAARSFPGRLSSSGHRFHDFRAGASGDAAAFYFDVPGSVRVIVARVPDPDPTRP